MSKKVSIQAMLLARGFRKGTKELRLAKWRVYRFRNEAIESGQDVRTAVEQFVETLTPNPDSNEIPKETSYSFHAQKKCVRCGELKYLQYFARDARMKDGRVDSCLECTKKKTMIDAVAIQGKKFRKCLRCDKKIALRKNIWLCDGCRHLNQKTEEPSGWRIRL